MDKFALVYEFNTESPLITYKASKELEAKNYEKAIELLELAIEKFPFHSTAYFIYSEALAKNNQIDAAKEMLSKGDDLLKEEHTYNYYLNLIDNMNQKSEQENSKFDETVGDILNNSFIENEDFDPTGEIDYLENNYVQTESGSEPTQSNNSIVTETLAEIYASQNNYEEAIQIFEQLKVTKPELTQKFDNRIIEIQHTLNNNND